MRVLAIDYGQKKIGMAMSDELALVTTKLPVLLAGSKSEKLAGIHSIICELRPEILIIGMPSKFDVNSASEGIILEIEKFVEDIKKYLGEKLDYKIKIRTWDESYSSKTAQKGKSKKFKQTKLDSEAARVFLQEYLESPDGLINDK